eukprot:3611997-Pyramimonas_sp.AAC.1
MAVEAPSAENPAKPVAKQAGEGRRDVHAGEARHELLGALGDAEFAGDGSTIATLLRNCLPLTRPCCSL